MNLFVQPHPDDVPWSCGGTLARLREFGAPCLVLTVFDSGPDPAQPLTEFARRLHEAWGTGDDPSEVRRAENQAALRILDVDGVGLGMREGLYRDEPCDTVEKLFSPPNVGMAPLAREIEARILECVRDQGARQLFLPLGVGTQVDHVLCFLAGDAAHAAGVAVYYYEELPYVTRDPAAVGHRLGSLPRRLEPRLVDVTATMSRRLSASFAYATQVPTMFRGLDAEIVIRAYAADIGGGSLVERFWVEAGTPALP